MGMGKKLVVGVAGCLGLAMLVGPMLFLQTVRLDYTVAAADRANELNQSMAEMDDPDGVRDFYEAGDAEDISSIPVRRIDGAYYPDGDTSSDDSGMSAMAIGLSGLGGLLVFGLAGLGSYRVLSSFDEEVSDEMSIGVLEDDSLAPGLPVDVGHAEGSWATEEHEADDGYDEPPSYRGDRRV